MEKKSSRNWWMYAFFGALFAFELMRELYGVAQAEIPQLLTMKTVGRADGITIAEGRWRRSDGGDVLSPNMVTITCIESRGTCEVTDVVLFDGNVMPPENSEYEAEFGDSLVTYQNVRRCVVYDVKIDTEAQHATQVRRMRPTDEQSSVSDCTVMDDRIDMVLTDGWDEAYGDNDFPEGFYPILRTLAWLVN